MYCASREKYERACRIMNRNPGCSKTALAKEIGLDHRTLQKMWEFGIPNYKLPPIKAVVAHLQAKTRAEIVATTSDGPSTAAEHADRVRIEEARMVQICRSNATAAQENISMLVPRIRQFASYLDKLLQTESRRPADDPLRMSLDQGVQLLTKLANLMSKINGATRDAMELERLYLGDPSHAASDLAAAKIEMSFDEASNIVEQASRLFAQARLTGSFENPNEIDLTPTIGMKVETI